MTYNKLRIVTELVVMSLCSSLQETLSQDKESLDAMMSSNISLNVVLISVYQTALTVFSPS